MSRDLRPRNFPAVADFNREDPVESLRCFFGKPLPNERTMSRMRRLVRLKIKPIQSEFFQTKANL